MSQAITHAFAAYWQECLTHEQPVVLDAVVLANIPGLDPEVPIDPDDSLPPAAQIVHRQAVDQRGRVNLDTVAYTIVMDTTVGDFEFNAMYLINTEANLVGMIVHKGTETKLKTDEETGQTGNSLVKSLLMTYDRASDATVTTVDASTWQIDYAARLAGMDDDVRRAHLPLYGAAWFEGEAGLVVVREGQFFMRPGLAVVGGLLVTLAQEVEVHPGLEEEYIYLDVHRTGTPLGAWVNQATPRVGPEGLTDYVDEQGRVHHLALCAWAETTDTAHDRRRLRTHNHHWDEIVDPPSVSDLGGLERKEYQPRPGCLDDRGVNLGLQEGGDMNQCRPGDYGFYDADTTKNGPATYGTFYAETKAVASHNSEERYLQMAYPTEEGGRLGWRLYFIDAASDPMWSDWQFAYATNNKPPADATRAAPPATPEAEALATRAQRMAALTHAMAPLQDAVALKEASAQERAQLRTLMRQRLALHRLPAQPDWPHVAHWPGEEA